MNNNLLLENSLLQNGRYRIVKILGQGGFGITYLAEQTMLGKQFAIKEFFIRDLCTRLDNYTVTATAQSDMVKRYYQKFIKEAQIIARFEHPGIVHVNDIFEENGTAYYVMNYVEGENLDEIIKREGALTEERALGYITKVANALDYIHQHNVNHLDIKPSNIMIRQKDEEPIIIDFGVSKQYDEHKDQTTTTPPGVSNGYSPLEQYRRGGVSTFSPQADVYALGATLFFLLTGKTPPTASDQLNDGLPSMTDVSPNIRKAIEKAMQPRISERLKNIREFVEILKTSSEKEVNIESKDEETRIVETSNVEDSINQLISMLKTGDKETVDDSELVGNITDFFTNENILTEKKKKAFVKIKKIANQGNANAQYLIGMCYFSGYGVTRDEFESIRWYEKAAEQGDVFTQWLLGVLYSSGSTEDKHKSAWWYHKAAMQGYGKAQYELGYCYEFGHGVNKDESEAVRWYRKAAEKGDDLALHSLGDCYLYGKGVTKDESEAVRWYRKAAEKGSYLALRSLGDCYLYGKGVTKDESEAVRWYRKAAEKGDVQSQIDLGDRYLKGRGVPIDEKEAVLWYRKAAEQKYGGTKAQYALGNCYLNGIGVSKDESEAVRWFKKSAEQGDADAQFELGCCYKSGKGVLRNKEQAIKWFKTAADNNHEKAQLELKEPDWVYLLLFLFGIIIFIYCYI